MACFAYLALLMPLSAALRQQSPIDPPPTVRQDDAAYTLQDLQDLQSDRIALDSAFLDMASPEGAKLLREWTDKLESNLKAHKVFVSEGNTNEEKVIQQAETYSDMAEQGALKTVCETGFNAGHSALRFLTLSKAQVYEFDLGAHKYAHISADFLTQSFPGRLNVTFGDSTQTVPAFHKANPGVKCDLAIVDGGHSYEVAMADLASFNKMVRANHVLVMDDTPCKATWCQGPNEAWKDMKRRGCITETRSVPMGRKRGFVIGKYTDKCMEAE